MKYIFENKEYSFDFNRFDSIAKTNDLEFRNYFLGSMDNYVITNVPLRQLKPISSDIDINVVLVDMLQNKLKEEEILVTNDMFVVSDPNQLAKLFLVWGFDSERLIQVKMLGVSSDDYYNVGQNVEGENVTEDYGVQTPSNVVGMGDVNIPSPTNGTTLDKSGSGDIPTVQKKKRKYEDINNDIYTLKLERMNKKRNGITSESEDQEYFEKLKVLKEEIEDCGCEDDVKLNSSGISESKKIEDINFLLSIYEKYRNDTKFKLLNESKISIIDIPLDDEMYKNTNPIHSDLERMFGVKFVNKNGEVLTEQKKLDLHFESVEEVDDLKECQNIPVKRKYKQITESEFSCNTLEGITHGKKGDYIVVGVDNEIYPCDAEIFEKTYKKL